MLKKIVCDRSLNEDQEDNLYRSANRQAKRDRQVMQPILAVSIAKGTQHSKSFDRSSAKCLKAAQKSIKFLCLHTMSQALARMQLGLLASLSTQECTQVRRSAMSFEKFPIILGEALASLLLRGPFLNARSWTWLA
eukprot:1144492-Pelagomonas_calceolata.AAC.1